jgi:hypothetical protein
LFATSAICLGDSVINDSGLYHRVWFESALIVASYLKEVVAVDEPSNKLHDDLGKLQKPRMSLSRYLYSSMAYP